MKRQTTALGLLSSIARLAVASAKLGDVEYGDQAPGTYCVTYLSTYLVPISIGTELPGTSQNSTGFEQTTSSTIDRPGLFSSDIVSDLLTTLQLSSVPASQSTSVDFNPTGQRIILAVTPSEDTRKRDIGGFVGTGDSDDCTFAIVFTLGNGRLFDGGVPISYLGEAFQSLQSRSVPSGDDITTTFSSDGGVLRFVSPGLPGGEASFCQTSSDGQVYLTFTSQPQGCVPVRLTIYRAERCIDGRIDGIETSIAPAKPADSTQVSEQPVTQRPRPPTPDPTDEEPEFPTMTIDPTRPLSFSNSTSRLTTAEPPAFTSGILLSSLPPTRSEEPTSDEPSSDEPSSVGFGTSVAESTTASPPGESSSLIEILPSSSVLTTTVTTGDDTFSSTEFESPSSTGDSESSLTETSDSSAPVTTSFETTTEDPTTTSQMETTTTTEEAIIITNRAVNGRFAKRHPNSDNGVMGFETEGTVAHRNGDCFNDDSSQDDGCVALEIASDRKRGMGSFAGISQQLLSGPRGTLLYTVQFYYAVVSVQGSRPCTLDAYLGNQQVCSERLSASDSLSKSWQRVLTTVRADSHSTDFGITISCLGSGEAMVYVDSLFISNQVTADNIDNHHLVFEDMEDPLQY
ncbi:hypothetical protein FIE12Z_1365 [Fusarium flagelliforme]|uniref:DUF7908 domain-containing protein n=1 Tax=Fusarium flagelliforme TaxID=2675880 RepID=A0A395N3U5_9HYPO|nr:hypothetical protein FIE12Z_1365 [Fusarium flagelliforme]